MLATALSFCVSSAFAAETAVLKVNGTLTNAACTPELSDGGVIDYGYIHLSGLSATENNRLSDKDFSLIINCTSATKVSWSMMDDRADSRAGITITNGRYGGGDITEDYFQFGVGKTDSDVNIGNYSIHQTENKAIVDGVSSDIISRNADWADTKGWSGAMTGIRSDKLTMISVATAGSLEPLAFTTAEFPLVAALTIKDTASLAISDDTSLDGQATISITYL